MACRIQSLTAAEQVAPAAVDQLADPGQFHISILCILMTLSDFQQCCKSMFTLQPTGPTQTDKFAARWHVFTAGT